MSKKTLCASETLYRILLRLYPAEYQRAYGRLMAQTFRDMSRAACNRGGLGALLDLWRETFSDVLVSTAIEHIDAIRMRKLMSKKGLMTLGLVLVFSLLTGYLNMTATEVIVPMSCILLFSFLAGLIQPKAAWRWAVLIGLSIPLSTFVGLAINFNFPDAPPRFPITLLVLVIPALVAAYGGSLINRVFMPVRQQPS
jgi:hypothetical protein